MTDTRRRRWMQSLAAMLGGAYFVGTGSALADDEISHDSWLGPDLYKGFDTSKPLPPIEHVFSQYVFKEHLESECNPSEELLVTSVRHLEPVRVYDGTMKVFYPDSSKDEFTKTGGIYWTCGTNHGNVCFKLSPWMIMVIRADEGHVHWHSMSLNAKC